MAADARRREQREFNLAEAEATGTASGSRANEFVIAVVPWRMRQRTQRRKEQRCYTMLNN
jgi:hypothetical protein